MTDSRAKGAMFERDIAKELFLLTGITFKRNLEQVRAVDHCDLLADNPAWPFSLELKAYKDGKSPLAAWFTQAESAAAKNGKLPCVVWKFNRMPIRCAVPFAAIGKAVGGTFDHAEYAHISIEGLAYLAREIMARNANVV